MLWNNGRARPWNTILSAWGGCIGTSKLEYLY